MPGPPAPALAGIRVLEFPQAVAAPSAGRYLADMGADVVRIEDPHHLDNIRHFGSGWLSPEVPPQVARDTRPSLSTLNAGKRSVGIDLGDTAGREVVLRLASAADVVVANLSASAMPSLGLAYEDFKAVRPDIVYCTLPSFGMAPSPYRDFKTWGPNLAALSGLDHLTGWPDRPACGMGGISYVDFLVGAATAAVVVAGLLHRDMTGEGQLIDISQHEVAAGVLAPHLMALSSGARPPVRVGNANGRSAPHGVYPSRGDDRWIAIAVADQDEWKALCNVAGSQRFASDPRFASLPDRLRLGGELDAAISAWTSLYTSYDLASRLQEAGVPAGMVQDLADLACDPQLESREFFYSAPHLRFGRDLVSGAPIRVSGWRAPWERAGPCLGEDTAAVLEELAATPRDEVDRLLAAGVIFEPMPWEPLRRPYLSWARHFLRGIGWD